MNRLLNEMLCPLNRLTSWAYMADGSIKPYHKTYAFFAQMDKMVDAEFARIYFGRITLNRHAAYLFSKIKKISSLEKVVDIE